MYHNRDACELGYWSGEALQAVFGAEVIKGGANLVKGGVKAAKASKKVAQGTKTTKSVAKAVESMEKGTARATKVEQVAQQAERVEYTTKVAKAEEVAPQGVEVRKSSVKSGTAGTGQRVGTIHITKERFGHTFVKHGEDATTYLIRRAKSSGVAQGQFLDNQRAAQFILDNASRIANGATNVPIPKSFPAHVIMPDGTFKAATHICIVPGGKGVKTAYPIILLP